MSWGTRITILYVSFALMILFMVFLTMREKVDLVSRDYYEDEIAYQTRINSKNNAASLLGKLEVKSSSGGIINLVFPPDLPPGASGTIQFFRPSDSDLDEAFTLRLDSLRHQEVRLGHPVRGHYQVKIDVSASGALYYFEESFFLNP